MPKPIAGAAKQRERKSQLQAVILASMIASNHSVDATAQCNETGEWYIRVTGILPESVAAEFGGIKIVRM